jgi:hypothetical protein
MTCEIARGLLALSAAGLLDPPDQQPVALHVRECPACAAELEAFGAVASTLGRMPSPRPSAGLVYRTQVLLAIEADRRQGARLAIGAGVLGWLLLVAAWNVARLLGAQSVVWIWMLWCSAAAVTGAAAGAALMSRRRRAERRAQ